MYFRKVSLFHRPNFLITSEESPALYAAVAPPIRKECVFKLTSPGKPCVKMELKRERVK